MKSVLLAAIAAFLCFILSSCCGAQCRLRAQDAENYYVIKSGPKPVEEAAVRLLENEGYKPFVEKEKTETGIIRTVVTGKFTAGKPFNKYAKSALQKAVAKSGKQDIARAEIKKTILISQRWDASGERIEDGQSGVTVSVEFTARNDRNELIDSWLRGSDSQDAIETIKKLEQEFVKSRENTGPAKGQ